MGFLGSSRDGSVSQKGLEAGSAIWEFMRVDRALPLAGRCVWRPRTGPRIVTRLRGTGRTTRPAADGKAVLQVLAREGTSPM